MVDTKIRLIIFFAAKNAALYSQQKQDWELTVAQIMNSLLPNSELNSRKWGKPLDHSVQFSSVQFSSVAQSCLTLCDPMNAGGQASLSITNSQSSLKLKPTESVMPSSHLILCHPLCLLPPIPPSIRVFSNESTLLMRWPKYWSFSFSIIPSRKHLGLISFEWTGWISLLSKGLSRVFSNTTVQKHQFFGTQLYSPTLTSIHDYWENHCFG